MLFFKMLWVMIGVSFLSGADCMVSTPPCNIEESTCFTNLISAIYKYVTTGVPSSSVDPMKLDFIAADVPNLKFTLKDSTVIGYKNCIVENATLTKTAESTFRIEMYCPYLNMTGQYVMNGKLAHLPVQGKGNYQIQPTQYHLEINGEVKYINKGSEVYISIDKVTFKAELKGLLRLEMKNLFDGNQELADPINKYIAEYPSEAAHILDPPVFEQTSKIIVDNVNEQLQVIPVTKFVA